MQTGFSTSGQNLGRHFQSTGQQPTSPLSRLTLTKLVGSQVSHAVQSRTSTAGHLMSPFSRGLHGWHFLQSDAQHSLHGFISTRYSPSLHFFSSSGHGGVTSSTVQVFVAASRMHLYFLQVLKAWIHSSLCSRGLFSSSLQVQSMTVVVVVLVVVVVVGVVIKKFYFMIFSFQNVNF